MTKTYPKGNGNALIIDANRGYPAGASFADRVRTQPWAYPNPYTHFHAHVNFDADGHTDADANQLADSDRDIDADADSHADDHIHTHTDSHAVGDSNQNAFPHRNPAAGGGQHCKL